MLCIAVFQVWVDFDRYFDEQAKTAFNEYIFRSQNGRELMVSVNVDAMCRALSGISSKSDQGMPRFVQLKLILSVKMVVREADGPVELKIVNIQTTKKVYFSFQQIMTLNPQRYLSVSLLVLLF